MKNRKNKIPLPVSPPAPRSCPLYRVQAGCCGDPARAEQIAARLRAQGYHAFVIPRQGER